MRAGEHCRHSIQAKVISTACKWQQRFFLTSAVFPVFLTVPQHQLGSLPHVSGGANSYCLDEPQKGEIESENA